MRMCLAPSPRTAGTTPPRRRCPSLRDGAVSCSHRPLTPPLLTPPRTSGTLTLPARFTNAQTPKLTPSVRTASYHLWFTVGGCALPQQVVTDVQRLPWTITPQLYDDLTTAVRRENGGMPPPDARVPHTTPPRARAHCVSPTCPHRAHTPAHTPAYTVLTPCSSTAKHLLCHELFSVYCGTVPATAIAEYDPAVLERIASDA